MIITGNRGFIGKNLTNYTGWKGFDSEIDIRNYKELKYHLQGYHTVIHLAGLAGVKQSIEKPDLYWDVNVNGTYNVAKACKELGIRLIFAGSSSVYECKSPYAESKLEAERIIESFDIDYCILRFFTVFGEYNRKDMAVYKFTQAIREGIEIELYGDCYRDFTYVQDLCKGIQAVAESDITGTYDFGFGRPLSVGSLIVMLENVIGKEAKVVRKPHREFDAVETKSEPFLEQFVEQTPMIEALKNTVKTI